MSGSKIVWVHVSKAKLPEQSLIAQKFIVLDSNVPAPRNILRAYNARHLRIITLLKYNGLNYLYIRLNVACVIATAFTFLL